MASHPKEITLALVPRARFDIIDVAHRIAAEFGEALAEYRKVVYCSFHTTAGYLEQSMCARLGHSRDHVTPFIRAFQKLFPPEAQYRHDQMEYRMELSEEQRKCEPKNGDSHLTFIGSGLKNCVTYVNRPGKPVYFIDLDGIHDGGHRTRQTRALFYNDETVVHRDRIAIPVSRHPIDSINLKDPRFGFFQQLETLAENLGIAKGRIDLALAPHEHHAGLTVNEYETLLMRHDLAEVLRNPLKFVAMQGKHMLLDPKTIPSKTMDYAKYDLVHLFNEVMDAFGVSESVVEKILSTFIRVPASRFLRLKRHVSLLLSENPKSGKSRIVHGTYQSPILVQWEHAAGQTRQLEVAFTKFD
jgi:thiamine phosphate synthase YjbQ (UPF0047 family)